MRDLINIIESLSILTEKSRGLLYRAKGDRFFKGNKQSPEQSLIFDEVTYFPGQPGSYDTYEDMIYAYKEFENSHPNLVATNKATKASKAFAILTLIDERTKQPVYYARFFSQIKPDMTGAWGNNELPNLQLDKETSLKASYGLKPSDIFPPPARFKNIHSLLMAFKESEAAQPFVPGFEMLYSRKPQFPVFENSSEFYTAIRDDLGEIIGPVALIQNLDVGTGAKAAARDLLEGGDWSGSSVSFPSGKTNGLVDSYIVTANGVEVGISSKGEKGATASVKNIEDGVEHVRKKGTDEQKKLLKKYAPQIRILEKVGKESSIGFPLSYGIEKGFITQGAAVAIQNAIKTGAKTLEEVDADEDSLVEMSNLVASKNAKTNLPNYNIGYHALAALAQHVADDINSDPKFGEACLKFLNSSPTIQLHMSASKGKDNSVAVTSFISKYPPNFKGTVELDPSKNYSATAAGGRMNFAYNGADAGISEPADTSQALGSVGSELTDLSAAAGRIAGGPKASPKNKDISKVGDIGRTKRR